MLSGDEDVPAHLIKQLCNSLPCYQKRREQRWLARLWDRADEPALAPIAL
jgi:hypothetical protein